MTHPRPGSGCLREPPHETQVRALRFAFVSSVPYAHLSFRLKTVCACVWCARKGSCTRIAFFLCLLCVCVLLRVCFKLSRVFRASYFSLKKWCSLFWNGACVWVCSFQMPAGACSLGVVSKVMSTLCVCRNSFFYSNHSKCLPTCLLPLFFCFFVPHYMKQHIRLDDIAGITDENLKPQDVLWRRHYVCPGGNNYLGCNSEIRFLRTPLLIKQHVVQVTNH